MPVQSKYINDYCVLKFIWITGFLQGLRSLDRNLRMYHYSIAGDSTVGMRIKASNDIPKTVYIYESDYIAID